MSWNFTAEAAPLQNKVKASVFRPGAAPFGVEEWDSMVVSLLGFLADFTGCAT
jgi:hypothetical protein